MALNIHALNIHESGFKPGPNSDVSISIRSLCSSEDSRDISINVSFLLMLMLMFSDDIVYIHITYCEPAVCKVVRFGELRCCCLKVIP